MKNSLKVSKILLAKAYHAPRPTGEPFNEFLPSPLKTVPLACRGDSTPAIDGESFIATAAKMLGRVVVIG